MASKDVSIDIVAQDKTGAAFKSVKGGLDSIGNTVGMVTGKIAGLTAVLTAIGGITQIKGLIDSADQMNKLSQKTGIAVAELSSLSNTADLAGVSNEQLGSALTKLNKSIAEAAAGSKEQSEAFKNLGINVKDANGNIRPTADILGDVAGAFSGAADGATKTQYAMALFGKAGADLIPFLNLGKQGIKEFGASFGEDFAKNSEMFNDNLTKISQRIKGFFAEKSLPLLEALNQKFEETARLEKQMRTGVGATQADVRKIDNALEPKAPLKNLKPLGGEAPKVEQISEITRAYMAVSDQIIKLVEGEDQLKLVQFARMGATDEQIRQYEVYLTQVRNLTEAEKAKQEQDKQQQKIDEQITKTAKEKADAVKKIFEDTRTPLENYIERVQYLQELMGDKFIDADTFSRAVGLANDEFRKFTEKGKSDIDILTDAINNFGGEFTSTLTEAFMTGKLNFSDMVNSIQRDIIRMMIKKNITDPSVSFLTDLFKGFGARALGGPVSSNTPYMVGERGPELFVPNGAGNIVPNNKLGGGGVTVVQNINIDSRSDRASIMAAMNQAKEQAKAEIYRSMKSGGAFA